MNKWNNDNTLEHYSGSIYVTKGISGKGGNVCFKTESGEYHVLAHLDKQQAAPDKLRDSITKWVKAFGSRVAYLEQEG